MSSGITVVTGAAGFIGSAVVRQLLAAGHRVRAVVRNRNSAANLSGLPVELVQADVRVAREVRDVIAGSRFVFHVAADYRLWAAEPDDIFRNNVESTKAVVEAVLEAGVQRLVYTSSVATLALPEDGRPADETMSLSLGNAIGAYKRSKVAAEELVAEAVRAHGLPVVIVNPSTPIGPRDARPTPTGRIIVEAARGRMPAFVDTGLNLVHVDDVAAGHLAALQRGRIGERYVLGGQDASLATLLTDIAAMTGRRPPSVRLPRAMLFPVAYLTEALARRTGREPLLTVDGLRLARHRMFFSSAKAEQDLGYRPRPYQDGLRDALAWFRGAGMIA
jgi:dihydroflavonol-4-reductase